MCNDIMILFIGLEQMADYNDSVLGNASKEYASTEGYLEACIGDLSQIFKLRLVVQKTVLY